MATVQNIYTPGILVAGSSGATQFIANPWGICDVWIQCTYGALIVFDTIGLAEYGIIEYESLNTQGVITTTTFGNANDLPDVNIYGLPNARFVPQLASVTLALITDSNENIKPSGTLTLFQWG